MAYGAEQRHQNDEWTPRLPQHCISSEKEFPELANDDVLATYQKDYDDLVSLKEHKMGELALFLPCPVLDCPDSQNTPTNSNVHMKNNVKKHAVKRARKIENHLILPRP
ncbi:hypothetical protein TNIN_390421 [Trichonephila inaurata madagascariensis]|uniref:Uncharacterized protein n=1 Tax=Trichonephila inaurata madagascariensis TaxID=2747483 RepID=A0A8X7CH11_9ARAC|nr:hypothetical protein TNIN_390421 [Trichonephila inaurata madagascariensis]